MRPTMDYSSYTLPPECDGVNPCESEACQRAVAVTHQIDQTEFFSRVDTGAGDPKVYTASEMQQILSGGTCANNVIAINQNVSTNDQLNPHAAPAAGGNVAYSYLTFNGILSEQAEVFKFYLATGSGGVGRDVIFSVEFGAAVERFYDATQTFP
jgi:hypothetical protein